MNEQQIRQDIHIHGRAGIRAQLKMGSAAVPRLYDGGEGGTCTSEPARSPHAQRATCEGSSLHETGAMGDRAIPQLDDGGEGGI